MGKEKNADWGERLHVLYGRGVAEQMKVRLRANAQIIPATQVLVQSFPEGTYLVNGETSRWEFIIDRLYEQYGPHALILDMANIVKLDAVGIGAIHKLYRGRQDRDCFLGIAVGNPKIYQMLTDKCQHMVWPMFETLAEAQSFVETAKYAGCDPLLQDEND